MKFELTQLDGGLARKLIYFKIRDVDIEDSWSIY